MDCDNERSFHEGPCKNTNQSSWNGPVDVDEMAAMFHQNIDCGEESRKVVNDHLQIRNLFVLNQKLTAGKKRKSIDFNAILFFETRATSINFWGDNKDAVSINLQPHSHLFYEIASIRRIEIRISITQKQN